MNADLHMADDLKNTGKGNLFVIFGEPDIEVTSGQWLVARNGRMIANYEYVKQLSGLGSLEEINRLGRDDLSSLCSIPAGGKIRSDQPDQKGGHIDPRKHRGGGSEEGDGGVSSVSGDRKRLAGGDGNLPHPGGKAADADDGTNTPASATGGRRWSDAQRTQTLAALKDLESHRFPSSTNHKPLFTSHCPWRGRIPSEHRRSPQRRTPTASPAGSSTPTTTKKASSSATPTSSAPTIPTARSRPRLKAEINEEAWATLNSDTSRPFDKPKSGRIAVKVINHLGDEVMKVFRV